MSRTVTSIGPVDHGRRMSLAEFDGAEGNPGHSYELSRGVVAVVDVPNWRHFDQVNAIQRQLRAYDLAHPGQVYAIATGSECKILVNDLESERHPDIAVYKTPHPTDEKLWSCWIPELVIEVVSPGSDHRDYIEKPEEYLRFGVQEYWIVDEAKRQMLSQRRTRGRWAEIIVRPGEVYTTSVLADFEFKLSEVFAAIR